MKVNLPKILCDHKICISNAEARRIIAQGLIWVNGEEVINNEPELNPGDAIQIPFKKTKIEVNNENL